MPRHCAANGCLNNASKQSCRDYRISFHRFPLHDKELLKRWLAQIKRQDFLPSKYSCLCSEHFTEDDFSYQPFTNRRDIKKDAVPSIFVHKPTLKRKKTSHEFGDHSVTEKPFVCVECHAAFSQRHHLEAHRRIHTGERPFACGQCGKRFFQKAHLGQHLRRHSPERPLDCGECGKGFLRQAELELHLVCHTGQKRFLCHLCKRRFARHSTLRMHFRVHTSEKPHQCEACGKGFARSTQLKIHRISCQSSMSPDLKTKA